MVLPSLPDLLSQNQVDGSLPLTQGNNAAKDRSNSTGNKGIMDWSCNLVSSTTAKTVSQATKTHAPPLNQDEWTQQGNASLPLPKVSLQEKERIVSIENKGNTDQTGTTSILSKNLKKAAANTRINAPPLNQAQPANASHKPLPLSKVEVHEKERIDSVKKRNY